MHLAEIQAKYRLAKRHNPDDFYPNTFRVETEGSRLVLVGVVKRHLKKRYRIVGILKPR